MVHPLNLEPAVLLWNGRLAPCAREPDGWRKSVLRQVCDHL